MSEKLSTGHPAPHICVPNTGGTNCWCGKKLMKFPEISSVQTIKELQEK